MGFSSVLSSEILYVGALLFTEMSQDYVLWQKLSLDWLTERDFVPQD